MWRQLGDQGLAGAQFDLGFMYANGRGVPLSYEPRSSERSFGMRPAPSARPVRPRPRQARKSSSF